MGSAGVAAGHSRGFMEVPDYVSPWNKWFPYEPVPCSPQSWPYVVKCEEGQDYLWCACGECASQPWADGPEACKSRGFAPIHYAPRHTGTKVMCGCKHCGTRPLSNGT